MIELINVSKYYPTDFGRHYIFSNVSLLLPLDKSVGVLGPNGAGKSTFLRLIGGADIPSEGKILKSGRISPPMGLTPGLQNSLTATENARFAGRVYGMTRDEISDLIEYVRELANIGKFFDMPVGTYSAGMKQRVAFAINMSMSFDYYLFDEIGAGGDKEFRKTAKSLVQQRLQTSKFIIASHRSDELLDICDSGIVIRDGTLTFYDDIEDALTAYGEDDEKADRDERRAKRRARKGELVDGEKSEEQTGTQAEAADPKRQAKRDKRRKRRESRDKDGDQAEAAVASPETAPPLAAAAPLEAAAPDAPLEQESSSEDADRDARRTRRREKKRVASKRQRKAAKAKALAETQATDLVSPPGDQPMEQTPVNPPDQPPGTPPAISISREDMKRERRALAEARRQARLEARLNADANPSADHAEDNPASPADDIAAEEGPVLTRAELRARRALAREERQKARAAAALEAGETGAAVEAVAVDAATALAPAAASAVKAIKKTAAEREALRLERAANKAAIKAANKAARAARLDAGNASNSDS